MIPWNYSASTHGNILMNNMEEEWSSFIGTDFSKVWTHLLAIIDVKKLHAVFF